MNINYKYVTILLAVLLVVTYAWHWSDIVSHGGKRNNAGASSMMHTMPNGKMMNDDSMAHSNTEMSMGSMMNDMLASMKGKTGTELEKVFLAEMIVHHQGAVDMAIEVLKDKTIRPELATFARDIITAQTGEIAMQKKWLKEWFGIVK